jgi:hypothetical protein
MTKANEVSPDLSKWVKAIPLLSLDLLRPLFSLMGLSPRNPQQLQQAVRGEIMRARWKFEQSAFHSLASVQEVVEGILESVEPSDADHLRKWTQFVFHGQPTDNLDLRQWLTFLRHCRRNLALWNRVFSEALPPAEALNKFERAIDISEFDTKYEELSGHRLSDWDLHIFAVHFFDDDDSEGTPNGPYLWAAPTVRDFQALKFFGSVLSAMRPEQVDRWWKRAERVAGEEQIGTAGKLPDPRQFLERLP